MLAQEEITKRSANFLQKKIVAVVAETHDDFIMWQAENAVKMEHYILISRPFYDGMIFDRIEIDAYSGHKVPKQYWQNLKTI